MSGTYKIMVKICITNAIGIPLINIVLGTYILFYGALNLVISVLVLKCVLLYFAMVYTNCKYMYWKNSKQIIKFIKSCLPSIIVRSKYSMQDLSPFFWITYYVEVWKIHRLPEKRYVLHISWEWFHIF